MISRRSKQILVITSHPDDADVHAGGTIARWVDEGRHVHYLIFTGGDKGHDDPGITAAQVTALRRAEQETAAAALGVQRFTFLDYKDGDLAWAGPRLAEEATAWLRRERPDVVVTHDPYAGPPDYRTYQLYPDHRALGLAVLNAVYFRTPGPLFYPEQIDRGLSPHRTGELFLFMGNHTVPSPTWGGLGWGE